MSQFIESEYLRHCAVLEVVTDMPLADIETTYRTMAKRWHPDLHTDSVEYTEYTERTKQINVARDYISEHWTTYQTRFAVLSRGRVAADTERQQREDAEQRQRQATQTRTNQNSQRQQQADAARRREEQAQAARAQAERERQERAAEQRIQEEQRRANELRERRETLYQPDFATYMTAQELEALRDRFLAERDSPTISRNKRDDKWFAFVEETFGTVQKEREREQELANKRECEREAEARQRELDLAEAARLQEARRLEEQRQVAWVKAERERQEREEQEPLAQVERERIALIEIEKQAKAEQRRADERRERERDEQLRQEQERQRQVKEERERLAKQREAEEQHWRLLAESERLRSEEQRMKKDAKEKMEITHLKQQIEEQNRVIQNLTRSHDEFDSSELDRVILKSIFDSWWQSGDFLAEHRVSEWNRFITLYRLHEDEKLRRSEAEERQRIATENERQQKELEQKQEARRREELRQDTETARQHEATVQGLKKMFTEPPVKVSLTNARELFAAAQRNTNRVLAFWQLSVLHRRLGHTIVRIPLFAYAKSPEGVQLKQLFGEVKSKIEELDRT